LLPFPESMATDAAGALTFWNSAAERIFGYTAAEAIGADGAALTMRDPPAVQVDAIMAALRRGESWSGRFVGRRKDGSAFPIHGTHTPLVDGRGEFAGVVGVVRDVSEEQLHRGIVEAAQEGIIKVEDRIVTFSNPAAARILRLPQAEIVGRPLSDLLDDDQLPLADAIRARLLEGESVQTELRGANTGGCAISATALRDESYPYSGTVTMFADVTDRRSLEQVRAFRATHDELTGLVNRTVLVDRLEAVVTAQKRSGQPRMAVLSCDLDPDVPHQQPRI
jgi:PAS domain S-box-containing protein